MPRVIAPNSLLTVAAVWTALCYVSLVRTRRMRTRAVTSRQSPPTRTRQMGRHPMRPKQRNKERKNLPPILPSPPLAPLLPLRSTPNLHCFKLSSGVLSVQPPYFDTSQSPQPVTIFFMRAAESARRKELKEFSARKMASLDSPCLMTRDPYPLLSTSINRAQCVLSYSCVFMS